MFTYAGGVGARATKDGLSATAYPTGVAAVPVEVIEAMGPISFVRKELRRGSGGHGRHMGGLGQVIEFTVDVGTPWVLNAVTSRLRYPPLGLFGGQPGSSGRFLVEGEPVRTQQRLELQPGDLVRLELPGGGGYGEPAGASAVV
jgi:N-methylhydantoinase B